MSALEGTSRQSRSDLRARRTCVLAYVHVDALVDACVRALACACVQCVCSVGGVPRAVVLVFGGIWCCCLGGGSGVLSCADIYDNTPETRGERR